MLLLEVLRRAAHDWVLYRDSTRIHQRILAEEAYHWLFEEGPGTESWSHRLQEQNEFTSFYNICDILSIDPEQVRGYARRLDIKKILSTGRPPTYRKNREHQRSPARPKLVVCSLPSLPPAPVHTPDVPLILVARPQLLIPVPKLHRIFEVAQRTVDTLLQHLG